jgi:transposase
MMRSGEAAAVYLCREAVDLRRSIDGLSAWVERELALDPFAAALFVFTNRRRDKVKVLYWERSGFVVWYKRLEKARFPWPEPGKAPLRVTGRELNWLLDGIDFFRFKPHEALSFESVL